jgi:hypothetical protein
MLSALTGQDSVAARGHGTGSALTKTGETALQQESLGLPSVGGEKLNLDVMGLGEVQRL